MVSIAAPRLITASNNEIDTGNIVSFDVEPNLDMRIIPVTKARA